MHPKYTASYGAQWPLWTRACHHFAHHNDKDALTDLLAVVEAQLESSRSLALLRILDACTEAAGLDLLPVDKEKMPGTCAARRQRIANVEGYRQLVSAFKSPLAALGDSPQTADRVRLPVLLVDDSNRTTPQGFAAWLDLALVTERGANLALAPAAASALVATGDVFTSALQQVTRCLRQALDASAPAVRDNAILWRIQLIDPSERLTRIDGTSMSGAVSVGSLWLLKEHAPQALRVPLQRMLHADLHNTVIAAAFCEPVAGTATLLKAVGGVDAKVGAWLSYCNTTLQQDAPRVFVARDQDKGRFADELSGCEALLELVEAIAKHHKGTLSQPQEALLAHLLADDESVSPLPNEQALQALDDPKTTRVNDWLSFFLHRYAGWCLHANDALHMSFVPLYMAVDAEQKRVGRSDEKENFESIESLLKARDRRNCAYLLVGGPGSGKSTLLQHLELSRAKAAVRSLVATGRLPDEICLYLRMRDYKPREAKGAPVNTYEAAVEGSDEVLSRMLKLAFPDFSALHELLTDSLRARQPRIRFLFDGINEIQPPADQTWQQAINQLADWIAQHDASMQCAIFSTRSHEKPQIGTDSFRVREVELKAWNANDLRKFFAARLDLAMSGWRLAGSSASEIKKARADWQINSDALLNKLSPQSSSDASIGRREPNEATQAEAAALLALFSVPMHAAAQAELMQEGVIARNRATLFRLWLWKKLRREWAKGGLARSRLEAWIEEDDHEWLLPNNNDWTRLNHTVLPRGRLIATLNAQGWAQWFDAYSNDVEVNARGRVSIPVNEVLPDLSADGKKQWLLLVQALGLGDISRAKGQRDRLFAFSHQLWGEFFAASGALPSLSDIPKVVRTESSSRLPALRPRDADAIAALGSRELLAPPAAHGLQEIILFALEALEHDADLETWIRKLASDEVNLTLAARAAVSVRFRLEPHRHQCWVETDENGRVINPALAQRVGGIANGALRWLRGELLRCFTQPVLNMDQPNAAESYKDIRHRREWGLLLGDLGGDPRFELCESAHEKDKDGQGILYLRPKADYRKLIGHADGTYSTFQIGHSRREALAGHEGEEDEAGYQTDQSGGNGEAVTIELAPFRVSAFPVTNAEYRCFVEAGGHLHSKYWTPRGSDAWRQNFVDSQTEENQPIAPRCWQYLDEGNDAQPVFGLTWFESAAYAAWLSACEGVEGEERIRLLTEGEWRAAAGGKARRRWAYGDQSPDTDPLRINFSGTKLGSSSPVGLFPRGATPEKIEDLSGNCWEWTASGYTDSLDKAELLARRDLSAATEALPQEFASAGGFHWGGAALSRVAYRAHFEPGSRLFDYGGLRVCGWRAPIKRSVDSEP